MIYVTGDIHGNQFKWLEQIDPVLKEGDIIIVCGDFGIGFFQQKYSSEESFYDFISVQPYTVLFVDGNHENFNMLNSYPVEVWKGGYVHKLRHNLIHLMRGEIYIIEGKHSSLLVVVILLISHFVKKMFHGGLLKCPIQKSMRMDYNI